MDVEDALELLGPSFKHPGVRKYAVGRMRSSPDNDLQLYLLQLVQALKYEKFSTNTTKNKIIEDGSLSSSQVYYIKVHSAISAFSVVMICNLFTSFFTAVYNHERLILQIIYVLNKKILQKIPYARHYNRLLISNRS